MKRYFLSVLPLFAIAFIAWFTPSEPLPIGSTAPKADVKMKDVSGAELSLNDIKKTKGLLVMFSCNTCPYVIKNQARTNEIVALAKSKGIGVAILNPNEAAREDVDSFEEMQAYAKAQQYETYYLVDKNSTLADAFGANRTPECFLFNEKGKLVYHGAIDDNPTNEDSVSRKHLAAAIEEMIEGKDISVKTSKSVGCTIKRLKTH